MTAVVRDIDGSITVIKSEYDSKKAFKKDLNNNGYVVIGRVSYDGENTRASRLYELGAK